jgi:hypothetical protein
MQSGSKRFQSSIPMKKLTSLLLLALAACMTAARPSPPPPPAPRFSVAAERQSDPNLCRRMADWDCENLDCPDCSAVAERARASDVGEVLGALAALGAAAAFVGQQSSAPAPGNTPFANALATGAPPAPPNGFLPATREASEVDSCRAACRRCAETKLRCGSYHQPREPHQ